MSAQQSLLSTCQHIKASCQHVSTTKPHVKTSAQQSLLLACQHNRACCQHVRTTEPPVNMSVQQSLMSTCQHNRASCQHVSTTEPLVNMSAQQRVLSTCQHNKASCEHVSTTKPHVNMSAQPGIYHSDRKRLSWDISQRCRNPAKPTTWSNTCWYKALQSHSVFMYASHVDVLVTSTVHILLHHMCMRFKQIELVNFSALMRRSCLQKDYFPLTMDTKMLSHQTHDLSPSDCHIYSATRTDWVHMRSSGQTLHLSS